MASEAEPVPPRGVLERALTVLDCFSPARPRWALRELASATGLDKATLLRLLGVLVRRSLLQRVDGGAYAAGPGSLRLAAAYNAGAEVAGRLLPVLAQLSAELGESSAFYVRDGEFRVCLCRDPGERGVAHHVRVGQRIRLSEGGSSAHVLLAYTSQVSPTGDEVRAQGFWVTRHERVADLASVAVPVCEGDGRFLGALVVIGPASHHDEASLRRAALTATQRLAAQGLGSPRAEGGAG